MTDTQQMLATASSIHFPRSWVLEVRGSPQLQGKMLVVWRLGMDARAPLNPCDLRTGLRGAGDAGPGHRAGEGHGRPGGRCTHCRSISCCSRRILLDSMASRFCMRSSCRCSSRCRASSSRSRSVRNSSRPSGSEKRPLAQCPGEPGHPRPQPWGPRRRLSSYGRGPRVSHRGSRCLWTSFSWLGRDLSLRSVRVSVMETLRPFLGVCGRDQGSEWLGLEVRGHGAPYQGILDLRLQLRWRWSGCGYSSARSRPGGTRGQTRAARGLQRAQTVSDPVAGGGA